MTFARLEIDCRPIICLHCDAKIFGLNVQAFTHMLFFFKKKNFYQTFNKPLKRKIAPMLRKQNKQKKKTLRRTANYINSLQGRVPAVLRHFGQVGTLPHKQFCLPGINAAAAHHDINQWYSLLIACPIKGFNQSPAKEAKHSELIKDRKLSGIKGRKKGPSCKPWIVETLQESKQCSC